MLCQVLLWAPSLSCCASCPLGFRYPKSFWTRVPSITCLSSLAGASVHSRPALQPFSSLPFTSLGFGQSCSYWGKHFCLLSSRTTVFLLFSHSRSFSSLVASPFSFYLVSSLNTKLLLKIRWAVPGILSYCGLAGLYVFSAGIWAEKWHPSFLRLCLSALYCGQFLANLFE